MIPTQHHAQLVCDYAQVLDNSSLPSTPVPHLLNPNPTFFFPLSKSNICCPAEMLVRLPPFQGGA